MEDPKTAWKRIIKRAGPEKYTTYAAHWPVIAEPGERLHRNQTTIEAAILETLRSWGGNCVLRDFYLHIARARVSVTSATFHAILDSMESRNPIKVETTDNGSIRYWLAGPRKPNKQTNICF